MGTLKRFYTGLTALFLVAASSGAYGQPDDPCSDRYDSFNVTTLFLPALAGESYALREYIRNCLPQSPFKHIPPGDELLAIELHTLDRIYLQALRLTDGDYTDAMLICTLGTLTHKHIPFTFGLRFPLTTESDSLYTERTARLPRMLFSDTGSYGDADKLQHFFGSAYATLAADGDALPDALGLFIELGESGFVERENFDKRDVRTNRLGQLFAQRLYDNPDLLPSVLFREWNAENDNR